MAGFTGQRFFDSGAIALPRTARRWALPRAGRHDEAQRRILPLSALAAETLGVFAVFFVVYAVLGHRVVVEQGVVVFDGLSRLAHAYFVWYNAPPKLAAIGFEWPPLQTLAIVPFAAIKPLATSMFALTLSSATFAAATVAVLNRGLQYLCMPRWMRYLLLVGFGLNPMFAWYAMNGMAEAVYLFFLTFGVYFFIRWYLDRQAHFLALVGLALAMGMLSRYELFAYAGLVALAVLLVLAVRQAGHAEMEGAILLYIAPVFYVAVLWVFFNWLIIGDALFFLKLQTSKNVAEGAGFTMGEVGLFQVLGDVLSVNLRLFPLTVVAVLALVAAFLLRRDVMSMALVALLSLNALFTIAIVLNSNNQGLLQLRYNMRAMPLAILAVGWLFFIWRANRPLRTGIWAVAVAMLLISLPITWHTMKTYPYQFGEAAAIKAMETGRDLENTWSHELLLGTTGERGMAEYIRAHVRKPNSILTDDQQGFSVMLLSGRPELFVDRIDRGDAAWFRRQRRPWRYPGIDYLMLSKYRRCPESEGCPEFLRDRYKAAFRGGIPWLRLVHETQDSALFAIVGRPVAPIRPPGGRPAPPVSMTAPGA